MKCPLVLSGIYKRPKPDSGEARIFHPRPRRRIRIGKKQRPPVPDRGIDAAEIEATINDVGSRSNFRRGSWLSTICDRIENVDPASAQTMAFTSLALDLSLLGYLAPSGSLSRSSASFG